MSTASTAPARPRRVVVVGGGFAGLFATRALRRAPVEVVLVDRAQRRVRVDPGLTVPGHPEIFLTGYRNRLGAVLSWATTFARDIRRERAFATEGIDRRRDEYTPAAAADSPDDGPLPGPAATR